MKILIVSDGMFPFSMGGSHRLIYELAMQLTNMGHTVICVIPEISEEVAISYNGSIWRESNDFKVITVPINRRNYLTKVYSYFTAFKNVVENCIDLYNPDVLNVHYLPALFSIRNIKHKLHVYYTFHGPWAREYALSFSGRLSGRNPLLVYIYKVIFEPIIKLVCNGIESYSLSMPISFMTISNYMRNILSASYKVSCDDVTFIPCGINHDNFYPDYSIKLHNSLSSGKKHVFMTVRRLEKRMGVDLLIKACSILVNYHSDFVLIIGGRGHQYDYLNQLIIDNKLSDNVKLVGFIKDDKLRQYISSADLFILPSLDLEGFGLVVLESLSCGTPILVSPNGGAKEVVNKFNSKFVLSALTPSKISEHILFLIRNNMINENNRYKANKFATNNYSWVRFSNDYMKWISGK